MREFQIVKKCIGFIVVGVVVAGAFFALSVRVSDRAVPGAVNIALPQFQPVQDALEAYRLGGKPVVIAPAARRLVLGGPGALNASESHWAFVRQSATWANGNSTLADQLITSLKSTGLLSNTSATTIKTTSVIGGVTYKVLLETNNACAATAGACVNVNSSAYSGAKTFTHRFKMWRASDGKDVLEMLFDDVSSPATGDGVLLAYRLGVLNAALSDNENLIVESYITGAAPNRRQTYSWGQAFWLSGTNASTTSDRGRVILEEMTIGLKNAGTTPGLCVRIAVRTVAASNFCQAGADNHYYALAYAQKTGSNFETTAQSGLFKTSLAAGPARTICSLDVLKNGVFNGAGFVTDNLADTSVATGFPDPATGAGYTGVTPLYAKLGTAGAGANGFDDTQQATIVGLATSVTFHPASEAPGF